MKVASGEDWRLARMAWQYSGWDSSGWDGWDWSSSRDAKGGHKGGSGVPAGKATPAGGHTGVKGGRSGAAKGGRSGGVAEAGKANSGGATTLPAGWEEVIDDCSGQAYYWQRSTGHTSWVPPGGSRAEPSSHRETAAQAQKRKRENRRRKGNASSQARERITAKFLAKLNLKDQQIGGLQALFANSVTMGQLRESERDKAQENKGGKGVGRSDLWGRVF